MSSKTIKERFVQKIRMLFDVTFWKFALVGIANTLVGAGIMFACYNWIGLSYWLSSALNYIVGSVLSYILNKFFTFNNKQNATKDLWKFIIVIAISYAISYGGAKPLVNLILSGAPIKLRDNISMLFSMGFYLILNYIGQRFLVFKKKDDKEENCYVDEIRDGSKALDKELENQDFDGENGQEKNI